MQWRHQIFFFFFFFFFFLWEGGIEGAKCISEGAKIQKFAKNGRFSPFFSSDEGGGKWGRQSLRLGGQMPTLMPPLRLCRYIVEACETNVMLQIAIA